MALALAPSPLHRTEQASHALGFVRHGRSGSFLAAQQRPPLPARLAGVVPPLQPGDVLLFTDLTLHRSGPNTTPLARWSADWAYELRATDAICPPIEPPAPPAEVGTASAEVATAGTAGLILTVTAGAAGAAGLTLTVTAPAEVATVPAEVAAPASPDAAVPAAADLRQSECACTHTADSSAAACPAPAAASAPACPAPAAAPAPVLSKVAEARWLRVGLAAGGLLILIAVAGSWVGRRRRP